MVSIEIGNFTTEEQVEKFKKAVQGKTYFDFQVSWGRMAGGYPVEVTTDYDDPEGWIEDEARKMLLYLVATSL